MSAAQSTPRFALQQPAAQRKLTLGDPGPAAKAPTERYRPARLDELVGQDAAVARLRDFVAAPYSTAFVFEGDTGTGKTSAALALAAELGACEFGGLDRIGAGEALGDATARALRNLHYTPMLGSGWRVLVLDEADYMVYEGSKSVHLFLSALEDLPPRSVVIFTTNSIEKFPQRFLDRCERVAFASTPAATRAGAEQLILRVWEAEGRAGPAPTLDQLPGAVDRMGRLSFRRVVQAAATFRGKEVAR
jgi:MoxR-like ATPase